MGETNSPSVAHVGYDISPLKRAKFKILTTSRHFSSLESYIKNFNHSPDGLRLKF